MIKLVVTIDRDSWGTEVLIYEFDTKAAARVMENHIKYHMEDILVDTRLIYDSLEGEI